MKFHPQVGTLCAAGNAADIHFVDERSLYGEPDSEDGNRLNGTEFVSIFIIYN
jgi:hypothetical protein